MEQVLDFVARHGPALVFAIVFVDQLGLPIPAAPILLALGALAGRGTIDPAVAFLAALAGSLCADLLWFGLGRWKGARVLAWMCRISLEPDTCVATTQGLFERHGMKTLVFAKFLPGFDTVAPPLAGLLRVGLLRFLLWSAAGAAIWLLVFGGLGYAFSGSLDRVLEGADRFGSAIGIGIVVLAAAYLAWKYAKRRRILVLLRMARITPDELNAMILAGDSPTIVDVRGAVALEAEPFTLPGARFLTLDEIDARHHEIPRDRDVVLYCT